MMRILKAMLFLLVQLLLYHKTTAIQEIRFSEPFFYNISDRHDTLISKTVLYNEALDIVFVNLTGITDFKCHCKGKDDVDPQCFTINDTYVAVSTSTTLSISHITNNMSTKWMCSAYVTRGNSSKPLYYQFEVKVKSAKTVNVTVNGMHLAFINATLQESEYDGIYEYHSEQDTFLDLRCSNAYADGRVQLQYFDAHDNQKIKTDDGGPFRFQQIMRSENHKSYVDCIYFSPLAGYRQEFKYRTVFLITAKTSRKTDTLVRINNMKIAPMYASQGAMDVYHYNFSRGETVTVTCEKDLHFLNDEGTMAVTFNNMNQSSIKVDTSEFIIDPKGYEQVRVHCLSKQGTLAEVLLNKDTARDPVIIGFPSNDLLYQFNKNNETWEAHYVYSANKEMQLKCVTTPDRTLATWQVESTPSMSIHTTVKDKDEIEAYVMSNLTFDAKHKEIRLICGASKTKNKTRTAIVVLHQKPSNKKVIINNADTHVTFPTAAACLVIVLLITVFIACVYYRRYRNKTVSVSEKPFKNFSDNTNPMPALPIPSAANEYTYITNENFIFNNLHTDVMKNNSIYFENKQVYAVPDVTTNKVSDNVPAEHLYSEINENILQKNAKKTFTEPYYTKELYAEAYDHCIKPMDTMKKDDNDLVKNEATKTDKPDTYYKSILDKKSDINYENLTNEFDAALKRDIDPDDNNDKKYTSMLG